MVSGGHGAWVGHESALAELRVVLLALHDPLRVIL